MRFASAGEAPAVEIAIASGPLRTIAGRMKLHNGGTPTPITSPPRPPPPWGPARLPPAPLGARGPRDVDPRVVGGGDHEEGALEVARSVGAPLPGDRALGGEPLEL